MTPQDASIATSLDLPSYFLGTIMLLLVMIFHGLIVLQIAKRYEVKSFLYLAEKKYSEVTLCFYISVFCLFLTHIAEIILWGIALYALKLLPNLGQSILFSGSTYTAMGFMEDILPDGWKSLAFFISFSGLFSLAWTTSIMIGMTSTYRETWKLKNHHHKV